MDNVSYADIERNIVANADAIPHVAELAQAWSLARTVTTEGVQKYMAGAMYAERGGMYNKAKLPTRAHECGFFDAVNGRKPVFTAIGGGRFRMTAEVTA